MIEAAMNYTRNLGGNRLHAVAKHPSLRRLLRRNEIARRGLIGRLRHARPASPLYRAASLADSRVATPMEGRWGFAAVVTLPILNGLVVPDPARAARREHDIAQTVARHKPRELLAVRERERNDRHTSSQNRSAWPSMPPDEALGIRRSHRRL
jgi:hypothetical protein